MFAMLPIFIQDIMADTKLTWHWEGTDQIDTNKRLGIKLKHDV